MSDTGKVPVVPSEGNNSTIQFLNRLSILSVYLFAPKLLFWEVCMDKDFSEGFMHDIADLLKYCAENNTDNVDLIFTFGDKELSVNIAFSTKQN